MKNDTLFNKKIHKNFEFDDDVAVVFDDMISRSVPYYQETLRLCESICIKNTKALDVVYDIGCSTANLLIQISTNCTHNLELIGIDSSKSITKIAKEKINAYNYDIKIIEKDVFETKLKSAKVIFCNYTLQFVRPVLREEMLRKIYNSLEDGGIFICSEKLIYEDLEINKQLIDEYLYFKEKNGYSKIEIMQKREALENVLIPYSMSENIEMLKKVGFKNPDVVFRWVNFATFFARK